MSSEHGRSKAMFSLPLRLLAPQTALTIEQHDRIDAEVAAAARKKHAEYMKQWRANLGEIFAERHRNYMRAYMRSRYRRKK